MLPTLSRKSADLGCICIAQWLVIPTYPLLISLICFPNSASLYHFPSRLHPSIHSSYHFLRRFVCLPSVRLLSLCSQLFLVLPCSALPVFILKRAFNLPSPFAPILSVVISHSVCPFSSTFVVLLRHFPSPPPLVASQSTSLDWESSKYFAQR